PISSIAELRELVHRQREEGLAPPAALPPAAPPRLDGFPPADGGRGLFGLAAIFASAAGLIAAARAARDAGYRQLEAYTPFHVEDLAETLGHSRRTGVPSLVLLGACIGGIGGYLLLWYSAAIAYPWNIGGRPLHSWLSFVPLTFELAVLGGSLFGFFGMLAKNRLPTFYHPMFNAAGFERAVVDRFILCIERPDPLFDLDRTRRFLEDQTPLEISAVPE
ncbi:MAG TPA: DUF3341 domain-containing protein, partial [Polyangia bacterium]